MGLAADTRITHIKNATIYYTALSLNLVYYINARRDTQQHSLHSSANALGTVLLPLFIQDKHISALIIYVNRSTLPT